MGIMENPFDEKKILEGMKRAGDRLVELGYAESYMVSDTSGRGNIVWTPAGSALKRELQKIFNFIAKDKGQAGQIEFIAFLNFLIDFKG
jgi:hypothetical protein